MPQVTKGGKYIFGWSKIGDDLGIRFPQTAIDEYSMTSEGRVFLISGSKKTGGFIVSRKGLLYNSKIGNILRGMPSLCDYNTNEGEFVKYKGRLYCWCGITGAGKLMLKNGMMKTLGMKVGNKLLCIRGSNIAFCMGLKGELIERAMDYKGEIDLFEAY